MASYIMFQGTGSHVGKSILTTALCRIFAREGMRTAPFKAQNMALNSYVTPDGKEMGRAQVAQAEAAGLIPETDMNPVLLKPVGNSRSQVIINGVPVGNMTAREYHLSYCMKAFDAVKSALARMDDTYDILVIEGAGSPAEVNLKDTDIVNMRVAKYLQAPVFLVADIDRGGSLAALVGTLELLEPEERELVKGLVINKFRGDISLFEPAVRFLEEKTGKPVIGVVPYIENMGIDEEDSVSLHDMKQQVTHEDVNIAVVMTPKISNFTDFDSLGQEDGIGLYYADTPEKLKDADVIILPGTKNTLEDLQYVRKSGMEAEIPSCKRKTLFTNNVKSVFFHCLHHRVHRIKNRQEKREYGKEDHPRDKDNHDRFGKCRRTLSNGLRPAAAVVRRLWENMLEFPCLLPSGQHSPQERRQIWLI